MALVRSAVELGILAALDLLELLIDRPALTLPRPSRLLRLLVRLRGAAGEA